jgi:hypothetical protein
VWSRILIFATIVAALCLLSAILLRMQRIGAKPGIVNRFAGLMIGHGFRLTRRWRLIGDGQLVISTIVAWLAWAVVGGVIIAIAYPGYDPGRMWIVYGLLSAIGGAVLGGLLAFFGAAAYARATNMSSFEGKAGYFVVFMGLIGAIVGALMLGIGMSIYFYQAGR